MRFITGFFSLFAKIGNSLQFLPLLLLRCFWGVLFFQAGYGKFGRIEKVASFFESLGIKDPEFMAPFVASVEMIGGILLVLGLFSRFAGLALTITMVSALWFAHSGPTIALFTSLDFLKTIPEFVAEAPVPYMVAALTIFCFGPGCISLDAFFSRCFGVGKK